MANCLDIMSVCRDGHDRTLPAGDQWAIVAVDPMNDYVLFATSVLCVFIQQVFFFSLPD